MINHITLYKEASKPAWEREQEPEQEKPKEKKKKKRRVKIFF